MLRNYFTIAFRNFWKHKMFTFINIFGLALGIACSILMALWVRDELRHDRFHTGGDRIYQVMTNMQQTEKITTWSNTPQPLQPILNTRYPDVEQTAVMQGGQQSTLFTVAERRIQEQGYYGSPSLFTLFSFPLVQGDTSTALKDINSIVISEALAAKLYGSDWAQQNLVGTLLTIDDEDPLKIGGVFQDIPTYSSLQFEFIRPLARYLQDQGEMHWGNYYFNTYVQLRPGTDPAAFESKIRDLIVDNHPQVDEGVALFLHPFEKQYLYSNFENGENTGGRIAFVRIFSVVAVLILLIACINFMNLATAQSSQRAKEIGIRKAVGAFRGSLILQFIGEAVLLAGMALLLALLFVFLLLPVFNELTGKAVTVDLSHPANWLLGLGLVLLTGLLAGSYPALFLSSFNTVRVLKGNLASHFGAANLRKALVVFQFALSMLMIIGTLVVHRQVRYIQTKDLGLERDHLVYTSLGNAREHYETLRNGLLRNPGIVNVTSSNQNPLTVNNSTSDPTWDGKSDDDGAIFYIINTDLGFLETMRMELKEGRDFSAEFGTDTANYIINETAARVMGMEQPVGQNLEFWSQPGQIIGVVKDFHLQSLHVPIEPLILRYAPDYNWMLYVRTRAGETQQAIAALEDVHTQYNAAYPFEYHFMDDEFDRMYRSEQVMGRLANYFAIIAVVISCLGLFGLASYAATRRTKEIGIRKALGASVTSIVLMLSGSFVRLVLIGFAVAAPLAYFLMQRWLDNFAYRTDVALWVFVVAGVVGLVIALLTISYRSFRAAQINPVEALRYE